MARRQELDGFVNLFFMAFESLRGISFAELIENLFLRSKNKVKANWDPFHEPR